MEKEKDIEERARARAWLDMAQAKWRLQTMQHRARYNPKTGEYRELPTRIRRFLNGTPVGMKTEVLSLLKESAPYRSPVFDCETDPGLTYRPTNTFIRKDGVEHATNGKDPTYTIIQDLLLDDGTADAYMFGDESTCSQLGETEYHWDEPDIMECPDGGQGVSYQITDISRDHESDLFSYRVRKVQTLTTHVSPYVAECDARKRVEVEQWDGVYGEPGSFRQDPVRGGSSPVDVPAPCDQPDGRSVRVEVYKNPDCTYRLTFQTTYAVADDLAQYSVYKDQYKVTDSLKQMNRPGPLARQGVDYSGGVMTRYTSERNDDGSWNNSIETETERAVPNSTVERRQTPRGVFVSRVDTNQATAASGIQTPYGSWKSTKTPGGLFTNEYTEYTRSLVDNLGLTCSETLFLHTHETQSSVAAVPASGTDAPAAAGGVVTTWTYDTDSEGFVTRRERTETEHRVDNAVKRKTNGYLGTTTGYTHRSVPFATAEGLYDDATPGRTVEVRRTNGGLYDVEVQRFLRTAGQTLGLECSRTMYQHSHEDVRSASAVGQDASAAGGGRTYRKTYAVDTSTGAVTERDQFTQELTVFESRRSVRVTARGKETRSTASNSPAKPADASSPGQATEWEVTPGGWYNATVTTTVPTAGPVGASCERDAFVHTDGTVSMASGAPSGHVSGGTGGMYSERSARLGDDGLWETSTSVHEETRNVADGVDVSVTSRGKRKTTRTRQVAIPPAEPTAADAGRALRTSRTRGGLYNVEYTETTARTGPSSKECSRDLFLHSHSTGRTAAEADGEDVAPTTDNMTGVYRSRRQQLGDDGLWAIVDTTNEEQDVVGQRVEERVTKHGLVRRTTDVQVTDEGTALLASLDDIGKERLVEKTRGGRRNLTTTEVSAILGTTDESCEKTAFLHTHVSSETLGSKALTHADDAADGAYGAESWTLTELGTWERRLTENEELQPDLLIHQYRDAFGETLVTEEFSNASESGGQGGEVYTAEALVQSVEAAMTNGARYNVRTKAETPTEVDSGWIHFEKATDRGLAVYYDFIVFRNATRAQVDDWIDHIQKLTYVGGAGSFANHPGISIAPNKFRLWDGTISLTTTFTPKEWAAGGSNKNDNWETEDVEVTSVNFVPLSQTKLLKIVTKEHHRKGGGVGRDRLESVLEGGVIKGSQFSFHPGGQAFSYDVITRVETKGVVMDMPGSEGSGSGAKLLWNGATL